MGRRPDSSPQCQPRNENFQVFNKPETTHLSQCTFPEEGLPNLVLSKQLEQPFTMKGPIFDLKVLNSETSLIFRAAYHTPLSQSIFFLLIIPLPEKS
jgi:hypothetical protein